MSNLFFNEKSALHYWLHKSNNTITQPEVLKAYNKLTVFATIKAYDILYVTTDQRYK